MDNVRMQREIATALMERTLKQKPDFYGSLRFNFHNGRIVNVNIEETVKPTSPK